MECVIFLENLLPVREEDSQFLGGHFNDFSITQNVNRQPVTRVLLPDFLNGGF
jgi:hypothetical protein